MCNNFVQLDQLGSILVWSKRLIVKKNKGSCLSPAPLQVRLISGWPRAMGAWWLLAKAGGRVLIFVASFRFVRMCVLLRKTRRRRHAEDGIKVSPPSPHSGGASSIVGGRVEVCLRRIYLWWIYSDLVVVRLCSCVFGLDPSDLHFSSSATVAVLVRWSYGALARRLSDCLLQQVVPDSGDGGVMTAARLWLASVLVIVARWSMNLDVIFIISCIRCTVMIEDE